jgi:hypothetical protein
MELELGAEILLTDGVGGGHWQLKVCCNQNPNHSTSFRREHSKHK